MSARYPIHKGCGGPLMPIAAAGSYIADYYLSGQLLCAQCLYGVTAKPEEHVSARVAWAEESAAREAASRAEATR